MAPGDKKDSKLVVKQLEKKAAKYKKLLKKAARLDDPSQRAALQQLVVEKLSKIADKVGGGQPAGQYGRAAAAAGQPAG